MTRTASVLFVICACLFIFYYFNTDGNLTIFGFSVPFLSRSVVEEINHKWRVCMSLNMEFLSTASVHEFWTQLENPVQTCERIHSPNILKMETFVNSDETKYGILPISENTVSTVVTIGIGQDVGAEIQLQKKIGNQSVQFYGADPISEGNYQLFQKVGTFFPFAIGNSSRMGKASVLIKGNYVEESVIYVEFVQFLKQMIGKTFFDNIWIDGEYAEYELFEYFYTGGQLDQNGITVCQFNMEVHAPNEKQKEQFKNFIERIYKDGRYAFFRPVRGSHIRLFFLNFEDPNCARKYISE